MEALHRVEFKGHVEGKKTFETSRINSEIYENKVVNMQE